MNEVSILLIGVSLSMDTFSLSLSIASILGDNKYFKVFPWLVGLFHFFMPLFGSFVGENIIKIFNFASNEFLGIILIILGINLFIHYFKDDNINTNLNVISTILVSLSVSIDAFSVGLGITSNHLFSSVIFSLCSFSFTNLGLLIGKYNKKIIGKYASLFGIILLLIFGIYHIFC